MRSRTEFHHYGEALSFLVGRVVEPVERTHRLISDRAFRYLGPPARPLQNINDKVVGGVYRTIRWTSAALGSGVGLAMARRSAPSLSESRRGSRIQAAVNALWGDQLEERRNAVSVELTIRNGCVAVPAESKALATAFPRATGHIVVLLHGFGQTERCWNASAGPGQVGLLSTLEASGGISPVLIRYNTGLSAADTGQKLAAMVSDLEAEWPAEVVTISLVGYSMGGLVARSAYASGIASDQPWARRVRQIITIATPHSGSPVARGVRYTSAALQLARTTQPLGDFLGSASAGVKDLEHGAGINLAWHDELAASFLSPAVRQHYVAAAVTKRPRHPIGDLLGDLVVRVASATDSIAAHEQVRVLGGRRHFGLLADPDVADQIIEWLRAE